MKIKFKKFDISTVTKFFTDLYQKKDQLWLAVWFLFLLFIFVWNAMFLNTPAFNKLKTAFINSVTGGILVVIFSAGLGWAATMGSISTTGSKNKIVNIVVGFLLNFVRSIPQIIGILIGYIILTWLLIDETITSHTMQILWMSLFISLFVFLEITDLLTERINHYRKTDFYNAMLACGMREKRIINYEIIWKNSLEHVIQKLISIFGITIFLQCSIDFIVSVGLTKSVSLVNFPTTLGNLLASMDSKQDILAVGKLFSDPFYLSNLFFKHLQGVSTAFIIVFSLLAIYKISNGYLERHKL